MINYVFSKLRLLINPEPIPFKYALKYIDDTYSGKQLDETVIDIVRKFVVPGETKVLDLGAGPGLYCKRFFELGAHVTWHDVSRLYKISAYTLMKSNKQSWDFNLDIIDNIKGTHDIIFNRVCWYYCINDKRFLDTIHSHLDEDGVFIGVLHNESRMGGGRGLKSLLHRMQFLLNDKLNIKIGHPPPSKDKIKEIFNNYSFSELEISDYGMDTLVVCKK